MRFDPPRLEPSAAGRGDVKGGGSTVEPFVEVHEAGEAGAAVSERIVDVFTGFRIDARPDPRTVDVRAVHCARSVPKQAPPRVDT